ncbi:MAG: peptide chain release factor 2 [Alphaproteobacteria bacterium]|nr:peptide chain release factor 2 [Alphaproteobacteria bacterium]
MAVDQYELKRDLTERIDALRGHLDLVGMKRKVAELDARAADPEFWSDQDRAKATLKEKAGYEHWIDMLEALSTKLEEGLLLIELGDAEGDQDTVDEGITQLQALEDDVRAAEVRRMLGDEADENDAVLEINSGAGGTDASDWAEMLKRMYVQWATKNGFKVEIADEQPHEEAGLKSVTLNIRGPFAYGYLKAEIGVHRLVRISPFDSAARRHTAFASVGAYPDVSDEITVEVKESDLRIDTYRSSGAGGQHVNTTDSAVRLTHLPTGLVVACQAERSQHKNKAKAMKLLQAKIYQHELQKRQAERDEANKQKKAIEWGSQIRSYVMQPYRLVKDLRTGVEVGDTDRVLNGDLNGFMEAWLAQRANESDAETEA